MRLPPLLTAAFVALALGAPASALAAEEPLPPQGPSPPGANDFECKPPPRHPYPVILVHGTFGNMTVSWNDAAPALTRLGYCVFALDYGNSPIPGINGVGDIPTSARQLKTFVDMVLSATGASKVAIVGHSQGGMMPRHLIKFLGGADKIDDLVGLSPSSHGTTNPLASASGGQCPACAQQAAGSPFMNELNSGDETPPPVTYTVVETRNDEVVTPYESEFLPAGDRVTNVLLQDACPADPTDHVGIVGDPIALQWMLNALGRPGPADPKFEPDCTGVALATFPDSSSVGEGGSDAGGSGGSGSGNGTTTGGGAGTARARLVIGHVLRHSRATGARRFRLAVSSRRGAVRRVVVTVKTARGKRLGTRRVGTVSRRRAVSVRLRRTLRPGRYVVVASGRAGGVKVSAKRRFTLR